MTDQYTILSKSEKEFEGFSMGFANRQVLAEFTGINYNTLTDHFVRKGQTWHFYDDKGILVIKVNSFQKGRQRVHTGGRKHDRNI